MEWFFAVVGVFTCVTVAYFLLWLLMPEFREKVKMSMRVWTTDDLTGEFIRREDAKKYIMEHLDGLKDKLGDELPASYELAYGHCCDVIDFVPGVGVIRGGNDDQR